MFIFPLLLGEENVLHSYFGTGCFFYALKTKLRLRKTEKEAFDVLRMKLYCYEN